MPQIDLDFGKGYKYRPAELYLKAPGWAIGWTIFALFCALP